MDTNVEREDLREDLRLGPEQLLAHMGWLRGLARALVRHSAAEDLAQDTIVAALRRPPRVDRPLRPWLGTVVGNLMRTARRDTLRREERHRQVGRAQAGDAPSAETLLERMEAQKILSELIASLPEPRRETVLLRYFEGLSCARIARIQGVPAGTVRWRLKQAIDELRVRLDRRYDGRRAWVLALAPLARRGIGAVGPAREALAGSSWPRTGPLALTVVAVVALGLLAVRPARTGHPAARSAPASGRPLARRPLRPAVVDLDAERVALEGLVVDPSGRPVGGAMVAALPAETMEADRLALQLRARTAARASDGGTFRLEKLPPGRYGLTALAPGYAGAFLAGVVLLPGETLTGLRLALGSRGVTVRGRVLDSSAGPIPRAEVGVLEVAPEDEPARLFQTASADDGSYAITLPKGSYQMVAAASGYASSRERVLVVTDQTVVFRLNPAGQLRGRVVERHTARPVAQALVTATAVVDLPWVEPRETTTDGDGKFALLDLEPAGYALAARKGNLAGQWPAAAAGDGSAEVAILVDRGATLSGRVLDPEGRGVAAARLRLLPDRRWIAGHRVLATSGADGGFRIEGAPPGRFALLVERPPYAPAERAITVEAARDQRNIAVTLTAGAVVIGTVTTRTLQPVAGAVVTATVRERARESVPERPWAQARTQADGRFRLEGLAGGELVLFAGHGEGHGTARAVTLEPGHATEVNVTLGLEASVSGKVAMDDGAPAAGVSVAAGWRSSAGPNIRYTRTSGDGSYRLPGVQPGDVTVVATRRRVDGMVIGHGLPHQALVTVGSDEAKTGVDLILPRTGLHIAGVVVGSDGSARPGVTVALEPQMKSGTWRFNGNARPDELLTGADGSFDFDNLDPQTYDLATRHPDFPVATRRGVTAGTRGVRVVLPDEATITGRALGADGTPLRSFVVRVVRAAGMPPGERAYDPPPSRPVQDPSGAFEVHRLPPGGHDVLISSGDGRIGRAGVTLAAGEARRGLLIRVTEGARLKLRVVEHGTGAPIAAARVALQLGRETLAAAETDAGGTVELTGLPPGQDATVTVQSPMTRWSYVADRQQVVLPQAKATADLGTMAMLRDAGVEHAGFAGLVGFVLQGRGGEVFVESLLAGSPAERAGIKTGDVLLSVDGRLVRGLGPGGVSRLASGAPGTSLSLGLRDAAGTRVVTLIRTAPEPRP
jgi:RNA polymerase sigma factor (sigma-70 family)